jgi:MerR family transcriptional regulator, light-induced transcriptional regulator
VPIWVGGPAFGVDDIRAAALGATAWASDAQGAVAAMDRMPAVVPPASPLPADAVAEQAALELDDQRVIGLLRERWSLTVDGPGDTALVKAVVVTDDVLTQVLHAISAVLLTGDPRPVPEPSGG